MEWDGVEIMQAICDWIHHFLYDRNSPNWYGYLFVCMSTFWTLKAISLKTELQQLKENANAQQPQLEAMQASGQQINKRRGGAHKQRG